jgi:hypothetical protein
VFSVHTNTAQKVHRLLLGPIVGATALGNWRLSRTWVLVGAAVVVFWIADSMYLVTVAKGTYQQDGWFTRCGSAHRSSRGGGLAATASICEKLSEAAARSLDEREIAGASVRARRSGSVVGADRVLWPRRSFVWLGMVQWARCVPITSRNGLL